VTPRRALVAGGTGLVGRELLRLLRDDDRYTQVTSLGRRETSAQGKIEPLVVSFDALDELSLPPVEDAFCCLGTTQRKAGSATAFRRVDFDYILAYARAAQRAGASRFLLVSSLGANPRSRVLYTRVKGETEAAIAALGFDVLGIVRPSFLMGQRPDARRGESAAIAIGRLVTPLLRGPLRRYRPVPAHNVAAALVRLAATATARVTILPSAEIAAEE
jgi:uncharacterized protein YbjT (DUF2867 family)